MEFSSLIWGSASAIMGSVDPSSLIGWSCAKKEDSGMYLDPLYTIFKLALINFYPAGSKLDFFNHEITISETGITQSVVRSINTVGGYGGSSWLDLHQLITPLYYGIKRLDPFNNSGARLICILAWRGLERLYQTYENGNPRNSYSMNMIRNSLQRMFEDAFHTNDLDPRYYNKVKWEDNPLLRLSDQHWMVDDDEDIFLDVHTAVLEVLKWKICSESKKTSHYREIAEEKLNGIIKKIKGFIEHKTDEYLGHETSLYFPIDTFLFQKNLNSDLNNKIKKHFWTWFKKDLNSQDLPKNFWKKIGLPIENPDEIFQNELFEWLALNKLDVGEEKIYTPEEWKEKKEQHPNLHWIILSDDRYQVYQPGGRPLDQPRKLFISAQGSSSSSD